MAFEYKEKFKKDIVIDLIGYRLYGHNELDEPSFTQPLMYNVIRAKKTSPEIVSERLLSSDVGTKDQVENMKTAYFATLDQKLRQADAFAPPKRPSLQSTWHPPFTKENKFKTNITRSLIETIGTLSVTVPEGFVVLFNLEIAYSIAKISCGKQTQGDKRGIQD